MKNYFELNQFVSEKLPILLELDLKEGKDKNKHDEEFIKILELNHRPIQEIKCIY